MSNDLPKKPIEIPAEEPAEGPAGKPAAGVPRFAYLSARITEEDDCFTVDVRLHNGVTASLEDVAFGEEIAESIEVASEMIAVLATRFSIPEDRINLEVRLESIAENTYH